MVPFSHHVGELRAHYAGFFDPGFGYGREGEVKGTVGVLEVSQSVKLVFLADQSWNQGGASLSDDVPDMILRSMQQVRPHETINIYDGQPICLMEFFRNSSVPHCPYGSSNSLSPTFSCLSFRFEREQLSHAERAEACQILHGISACSASTSLT